MAIMTNNPREGQVMYLGVLESIERSLPAADEGHAPSINHIERLATFMETDLGNEILASITRRGGYGILPDLFRDELGLELAAVRGWVAFDEGEEHTGNPYEGTEAERDAWAYGFSNAQSMSTK